MELLSCALMQLEIEIIMTIAPLKYFVAIFSLQTLQDKA